MKHAPRHLTSFRALQRLPGSATAYHVECIGGSVPHCDAARYLY